MDVKEVLLPGVGLRYEFTSYRGDRIGIVARRSGGFDVVLYGRDDPDEARPVLRLTDEEAEAVAQILGAPRIAERFTELTREVPGLKAGQIHIRAGSLFVDRPLGDTRARTRTGASIVAIVRDEDVLASPGPTDVLRAGDVLIVIGTEDGSPGSNRSSKRAEPVEVSRALLFELGVLLAVLAVLGAVARRFALSPIPVYLLAGLSLGNGGILGWPPPVSSSLPVRPSVSCCCFWPWVWSFLRPSSPAVCATTCRRRVSISSSTPRPVRWRAGFWGWTVLPSSVWPGSPTFPPRV